MANDSSVFSRTRFLAWTWCIVAGLALSIGGYAMVDIRLVFLVSFPIAALMAHFIHIRAMLLFLTGAIVGVKAAEMAAMHDLVTRNVAGYVGVGLGVLAALMILIRRPSWLKRNFSAAK